MEPVRASHDAGGWDLFTAEEIVLKPYKAVIVPTGLKAELPHGTVLLILPRSGYSVKNQIIMPNSMGVIDEDYRGGIGITMMWTPPLEDCFTHVRVPLDGNAHKDGPLRLKNGLEFRIQKFTRIAQALLVSYFEQDWSKADALSETDRGSGGFGHTGTGPGPAGPAGDGHQMPPRPK